MWLRLLCTREQCDLLLESLLCGVGEHIGKATYCATYLARVTRHASRKTLPRQEHLPHWRSGGGGRSRRERTGWHALRGDGVRGRTGARHGVRGCPVYYKWSASARC